MSSPSQPPISKRVIRIAAAVLALTVAAMIVDRRRVRTGELLIQSDRADVQVSILHDGRAIVTASSRRLFTLLPGDYEIRVAEPPALRAVPGRVSVARNGRAVVRIEEAGAGP